MAQDLVYVDANGDKQAIDVKVSDYREAAERGQSLKQYLATQFPTNAEKFGSAYEQLLEQSSVMVRANQEFGLRPSTIGEVVNPKEAAAITREGVPVSRLLFPAIMLDVIEDKLQRDYSTNVSGFASMVAVEDSIQGERWERPVISFTKPEAARSAHIAQLAMPNMMMSITSSDKSMRIPTWGIGMEISEQAQKSTTLDLVGLAVARQGSVEANERAAGYILTLLNGDSDHGQGTLAAAGRSATAQSFDAAVTLISTITFKAWVKWLTKNWKYRTLSHIVTDLDTLLVLRKMYKDEAINNGMSGNPSPTMETQLAVLNPNWPTNLQVFVTDDASWPANTIMGVDKRYGVHKVNSLTAQYSAVEAFAMRRSTMMRVDKGEMVYRLFDEAFEVLTLTV